MTVMRAPVPMARPSRPLEAAQAEQLRLAIANRLHWVGGPCEEQWVLEGLAGLLAEGRIRVEERR